MADTKLILGGIEFTDFEIPEKINFGQKQRLEIHKNIGGKRTIDAMGEDPDDISWSGRFRGVDGASRANRLYALAGSGRSISLTWGGNSFQVVVSHFRADYERFYEIPYQITCVVDTGSPGSSAPSTSSALIAADLAAIASLVGRLAA